MAKSRRNKVVHLTKVKPKGKEHKEASISKVREAVEKFNNCYVVEIRRCNTRQLQAIREALKPEGIIVAAKNSLMQVALGTDPQTSIHENIYKLSAMLSGGTTALIIGDIDHKKLRGILEEYSLDTFGKAGDIAPETVVLEPGHEVFGDFLFSMEPQLRSLGLRTQLSSGVIHLLGQHTVCKAGEKISSKQAQILKLLGRHIAKFELSILAGYSKTNDEITIYDQDALTARMPELQDQQQDAEQEQQEPGAMIAA